MYNGHRNRLGLEQSPYLLQHADNPVDWYPWGNEAFAKAKRENKPVFLSIGYSTCHWCHVMEHESFEDPAVARLMNETFVSVKVDREERPDIDIVYMRVCQMMTGSGGWPLSIFLTAAKKPFFADTYIPRESRFGKMGILELIPRIQEIWTTRQGELGEAAGQIASALSKTGPPAAGKELNDSVMQAAYQEFASSFDKVHGGFGPAPKFPAPHNLSFLLRYWKRTGNNIALEMVETTLQAMRRGGFYDVIGGGFHRYSTEAEWRVPHFEKMLYDQALLAIAYTEAFQATQKEDYAQTAQEILDYVLRDMTSREGGFYSAEDADSEGAEGKYYLWTTDEIETALLREDAELAFKVFDIHQEGNLLADFGTAGRGLNIIHYARPLQDLAGELGMDLSTLSARIEGIRRKLFRFREKRIHPFKDDKILTDWNGLMIAALAKASAVMGNSRYAEAARRAADFLLKNLRSPNGRLLHRFRGGEAALPANIDAYAFLVYGLMELYEATFEAQYLKSAVELNRDMISHFWDAQEGGFYFSAYDSENILVRPKEIYDGAVPSGNSIAMLNLLRLGRITGDTGLEEKAARTGKTFYSAVNRTPSAHSQLLIALDFARGPSYEMVFAGSRTGEESRQMLDEVHHQFIPDKVIIWRDENELSDEIVRIAPWIKDYKAVNGRLSAYVCRNYHCEMPVTGAEALAKLLREKEKED
jgi:uncharacterized protein